MTTIATLFLGILLALWTPPTTLANPTTYQCPNSKTNPLVQQGKRFYDSVTGEYVPIKGVAYYPRPNAGELSRSNSVDYYNEDYRERWLEDISYFKKLNINAIRIYAVDPSQWHEGFMCALQEAGIYVVIGLLADCLDCGIGAGSTDDSPPNCYSPTLKERGQFIITTFSKYDNVLAFSAGNEATIFSRDRKSNTPCQKKFIRDMRHFVNSCSLGSDVALTPILPRKIPIGVVGWDNDEITVPQAQYFACQSDPDDPLEPMEWYGINTYRHCDPSAQTVDDLRGYKQLKDLFIEKNFDVPILLAEYGCRASGFPTMTSETTGEEFEAQRTWLQIDMLYKTPEYLDVFAGGFAYSYSVEKVLADRSLEGHPWPYYGYMQLNYGMGYLYPVDCDNIDIMCNYEPYPESTIFGEKMAAVDTSFIPSLNDPSDQTAGVIPECPSDYPPLSAFVWPTDDDDDAILACTTSNTLAPTTSEPTTTPPATPSPTTNAPTVPDDATTSIPTNPLTTSRPTVPSSGGTGVSDQTDQPSTSSTTFETFEPTTESNQRPTTPGQIQETCVMNPNCAAQNALRVAGVESCCPTRDQRNLFLDCCSAVEEFCFDETGNLIVCQSMTSTQYVNEILTGQRNPNSLSGGNVVSAAAERTTNVALQLVMCFCSLTYLVLRS
ncbi:glucanosyltransferase [Nitzschia inconspicua]|uniref:Glucanosyltransferase n=1 Tax=Nitzschia inconspicua TaxID=303405 RepID=A0A9K3KDU9_9STRA|nr:glucanosyltransferase [Nitzschia inconspicua]KAG7362927.1 glucanosyltransferase [Nitzschia inconspicua]